MLGNTGGVQPSPFARARHLQDRRRLRVPDGARRRARPRATSTPFARPASAPCREWSGSAWPGGCPSSRSGSPCEALVDGARRPTCAAVPIGIDARTLDVVEHDLRSPVRHARALAVGRAEGVRRGARCRSLAAALRRAHGRPRRRTSRRPCVAEGCEHVAATQRRRRRAALFEEMVRAQQRDDGRPRRRASLPVLRASSCTSSPTCPGLLDAASTTRSATASPRRSSSATRALAASFVRRRRRSRSAVGAPAAAVAQSRTSAAWTVSGSATASRRSSRCRRPRAPTTPYDEIGPEFGYVARQRQAPPGQAAQRRLDWRRRSEQDTRRDQRCRRPAAPGMSSSPTSVALYEIDRAGEDGVREEAAHGFRAVDDTVLCDAETGQVFDVNLTPEEIGLRNGARLLMI